MRDQDAQELQQAVARLGSKLSEHEATIRRREVEIQQLQLRNQALHVEIDAFKACLHAGSQQQASREMIDSKSAHGMLLQTVGDHPGANDNCQAAVLPSRLLNIPRELRDLILKHLVVPYDGVIKSPRTSCMRYEDICDADGTTHRERRRCKRALRFDKRQCIATITYSCLTLACRQLRDEVKDCFFKHNAITAFITSAKRLPKILPSSNADVKRIKRLIFCKKAEVWREMMGTEACDSCSAILDVDLGKSGLEGIDVVQGYSQDSAVDLVTDVVRGLQPLSSSQTRKILRNSIVPGLVRFWCAMKGGDELNRKIMLGLAEDVLQAWDEVDEGSSLQWRESDWWMAATATEEIMELSSEQ